MMQSKLCNQYSSHAYIEICTLLSVTNSPQNHLLQALVPRALGS